MNFNTFTNYFFYLFVCYQYCKYHYPETTEKCTIVALYNAIYIYSKLEIIIKKNAVDSHNFLLQYEQYQNLLTSLSKIKNKVDVMKETLLNTSLHVSNSDSVFNLNLPESSDKITVDFIFVNEKVGSFEKKELLKDEIIDYDFIIVNASENLKRIITDRELLNDESIFNVEPFLYKPLLCEFLNGDQVIKIDFSDNAKFYDFLVVGNSFDKKFLTFFMKKYYDIIVKDDYVLKILDNNVNTVLFENTDILKINKDTISK
jgi:hypothetical protein